MSLKTSRRLAREWARANAPIVEKDLSRHLEEAMRKGLNCTIAVSRELTKDHLPHLLSCYAGEFFVFELTQRQAKAFQARSGTMQITEGGDAMSVPTALGGPLFELAELSITDADGLGADQPIQGRVRYTKRQGPAFPGTTCLALEFALIGRCRMVEFCYPPEPLLPEREWNFAFSPMANQPKHPAHGFTGTTLAHVRFMGSMNPQMPGSHFPLSNTCAALIELI